MTDSATFTTPEASDEGLGDLLLEVFPPDGSTIGNLSAREALGRAELCDEQITVKPSPRGQTGDQNQVIAIQVPAVR